MIAVDTYMKLGEATYLFTDNRDNRGSRTSIQMLLPDEAIELLGFSTVGEESAYERKNTNSDNHTLNTSGSFSGKCRDSKLEV